MPTVDSASSGTGGDHHFWRFGDWAHLWIGFVGKIYRKPWFLSWNIGVLPWFLPRKNSEIVICCIFFQIFCSLGVWMQICTLNLRKLLIIQMVEYIRVCIYIIYVFIFWHQIRLLPKYQWDGTIKFGFLCLHDTCIIRILPFHAKPKIVSSIPNRHIDWTLEILKQTKQTDR